MAALSDTDASVLASAYELRQAQVQDDAACLLQWRGSEASLQAYLQEQHGWTAASEYAPYYVADLRLALQLFSRNGTWQ
jgi:hypothetical protein